MDGAALDAARLASRECVALLGRPLGARTVLIAKLATAEPECRAAIFDEIAVDLADGSGVTWKALPDAVLWPLYERWKAACPPAVLDAIALANSPYQFSNEFVTAHLAAGMYVQSFAKLLDWLPPNAAGLGKFDDSWRLFMDSYELVDPNPFLSGIDREWAAVRGIVITWQPPEVGTANGGADITGDDDGYIPVTKLSDWQSRFDSYRELKKFLDSTPQIKTKRPSKQRLQVHAADWMRFWVAADKKVCRSGSG